CNVQSREAFMIKRLMGVLAIIVLVVMVVLFCVVPEIRYALWERMSSERFHEGRPVSYWISTVQAGPDATREHAAHVLGQLGAAHPAIVPTLRAAIKDKDHIVRKNAVLALGQIGREAQPATAEIIAALKDNEVIVRRAAAETLGRVQ